MAAILKTPKTAREAIAASDHGASITLALMALVDEWGGFGRRWRAAAVVAAAVAIAEAVALALR